MMDLRHAREKTTVEVWNVCECGHVLHSLVEAQRGVCGSCHFKKMPGDTKAALNKMIAAAFKPTSEADKGRLIDDAFEKVKRDANSESPPVIAPGAGPGPEVNP